MTYVAHAVHHTLEVAGARRWYDLPRSPRPGGGTFADLLVSGPDQAPWLRTSVWSGPVEVALHLTAPMPPSLPLEDHDLVVEVSVLALGGPLAIRGPEDAPSLVDDHGVAVPPGWLRLRLAARGRGAAYDEAVSVPVEAITVQLWPGPPEPTVDLKTGERVEPHESLASTADGVRVVPELGPDAYSELTTPPPSDEV